MIVELSVGFEPESKGIASTTTPLMNMKRYTLRRVSSGSWDIALNLFGNCRA
jgi:hypothetical protein